MKIYSLTVCLVFIIMVSKAQLGVNSQWTWMKGDSLPNSAGVYGTMGTSSVTSNPGARSASVSWKDGSGNLWLFGGGGYVTGSGFGYLDDLWKYETSTNNWTWINSTSTINDYGVYGMKGTPAATNHPGARTGGVSWTDPNGNLWLFGGFGYSASNTGHLNDLWKYDLSTNQWAWINGDSIPDVGSVYGSLGIPDFGNKPGNRVGSASWTDAAGNLWLFGGRGYPETGSSLDEDFNDLWKYSPTTNQWTWLKGGDSPGIYGTQGISSPTNQPGPRSSSVTWVDGSGNFWLFGGSSYFVLLLEMDDYNDLWKYDPLINEWTWMKGSDIRDAEGVYGTPGIADVGNNPGSRDGSISWTDAMGNLWLYGGELNYSTMEGGGLQGIFNDLWKYNQLTNQWTWMKGDNDILDHNGMYGTQNIPADANKPGSRYNAVSWADNFGNLWLYGGNGDAASSTGRLNDLWKIGNSGALPLILLDISATVTENNVVVKWQTSQEVNTSHFVVERSNNGRDFLSIGSVVAAGNSASRMKYSYIDQHPVPGMYYYRVKMVDKDGIYRFSATMPITLKASQNITVYPNPVLSHAIINVTAGASADLEFNLYDDKGSLISSRQFPLLAGNNSFIIDMSKFPKGTYTAVFIWNGENKNLQILKN